MWKNLIDAFPAAVTTDPAGVRELAGVSARLGHPLPDDLAGLLRHTDGVSGAYGTDHVWPVARIIADNLYFRAEPDFAELYAPFGGLLFFGDSGGGDQFAYQIDPPSPGIVVWDHETDERYQVADDLAGHLRNALPERGDWYGRPQSLRSPP